MLHGKNGRIFFCASFESWFYIPVKKVNDSKFFVEEKHVSVRGIYKDTVGSNQEFADYQFRPNCTVAMTVAPELFDPVHAVKCLNQVEDRLLGKIGMKTLDPDDYRYRPFYVNSEDSADFYTAKGFNYHNGPEWVWPVGYFFRASMRFRRGITARMKQMLAVIRKEQLESWACGLPELTQKMVLCALMVALIKLGRFLVLLTFFMIIVDILKMMSFHGMLLI